MYFVWISISLSLEFLLFLAIKSDIPLNSETYFFIKIYFCGSSWTRTNELKRGDIYSVLPLPLGDTPIFLLSVEESNLNTRVLPAFLACHRTRTDLVQPDKLRKGEDGCVDISFYDWHYSGVFLPTPMILTKIHSRVISIIIPQSTYKCSSAFYSQHRGIVSNLARLTTVWVLKFTFCTHVRTRT